MHTCLLALRPGPAIGLRTLLLLDAFASLAFDSLASARSCFSPFRFKGAVETETILTTLNKKLRLSFSLKQTVNFNSENQELFFVLFLPSFNM